MNNRVADMTQDELKAFVYQCVDERLQRWKPSAQGKRSVQEILASIEQHRWTRPTDAPSLSEMVIEERERWRQGGDL